MNVPLHVSVSYAPEPDDPRTGPVQIGWVLWPSGKSGVVFFAPERVRSVKPSQRHAKSASRCPAILNLESRYFVIRCPFDLHIGFHRDSRNKAKIRNLAGANSAVRASKLSEHLHLVAEPEWRYPDRPTLQVLLPYVFLADEPVYINQVPAFMHYRVDPLPGTMFGGRFPVDVWPRPLMWAFEWHEPSKPLVIKRGEPLFYCMFETEPADRAVQMVAAQVTPEVNSYLESISAVVGYVNNTFSLIGEAAKRRPKVLVQRADSSEAPAKR